MRNFLKVFEPNLRGRDFIIGDLHGAYETFLNLLEGVKFDPTADRMFSVGDLVDRGPQSQKCLELIDEPWFNSVLSNHEQMMYEAFHGGRMGDYWLRNGGFWGYSALNASDHMNKFRQDKVVPNDEEYALIQLVEKVGNLPYLITINHKNGNKYHVIHAELPQTSTGISDEDLANENVVAELSKIQSGDGEYFLWGRYIFANFFNLNTEQMKERGERTVKNAKQFATDEKPHLSHIFSGHTIMKKPLTIFGQTNLDTGAYAKDSEWSALTCVCLDDGKFYQAREEGFLGEVEPVVINSN